MVAVPIPPLFPTIHYGLAAELPADMLFFGAARQALNFLARRLLEQHERLLFVLPAYNCESIAAAIERAGGEIVFVDVDETLDFDLIDLAQVLDARSDRRPVLLPTSLFGAPLRDYKALYPDATVVEDRAQSAPEPTGRADYQILSFGKGKLVSGMGGGALLGASVNSFQPLHARLQPTCGLSQAIIASLLFEYPVLRWGWRYVQSRLDASPSSAPPTHAGSEPSGEPHALCRGRSRWIVHSLQRANHVDRMKVADHYAATLPQALRFDIPAGRPYLRYPVRRAIQLPGSSLGRMYEQTWKRAEVERGKAMPGAGSLVQCGLLPTHQLVRPAHLKLYQAALAA